MDDGEVGGLAPTRAEPFRERQQPELGQEIPFFGHRGGAQVELCGDGVNPRVTLTGDAVGIARIRTLHGIADGADDRPIVVIHGVVHAEGVGPQRDGRLPGGG